MVGWHHQLNGRDFEQTQGDSEGQGSLACCGPWDRKESNMTEWLNNKNRIGTDVCVSSYLLRSSSERGHSHFLAFWNAWKDSNDSSYLQQLFPPHKF